MALSWFDAREAEAFGNALAEFYNQEFRAHNKTGSHPNRKMEKQQKLVSQVFQQARQFRQAHKLNFYKKAKLGNAFKWKLRDLGHDGELIDQMTKDLMLVLR